MEEATERVSDQGNEGSTNSYLISPPKCMRTLPGSGSCCYVVAGWLSLSVIPLERFANGAPRLRLFKRTVLRYVRIMEWAELPVCRLFVVYLSSVTFVRHAQSELNFSPIFLHQLIAQGVGRFVLNFLEKIQGFYVIVQVKWKEVWKTGVFLWQAELTLFIFSDIRNSYSRYLKKLFWISQNRYIFYISKKVILDSKNNNFGYVKINIYFRYQK